jgi:hypothetical protein
MTLYALGWYTPVFPLLFEFAPGVDMFRRPADATFMMGALFALLSGQALNDLAREGGAIRPRRLAMVGAIAAGSLAAAVAIAAAHGQLRVAAPALAAAGFWCVAAALLLTVWRCMRRPALMPVMSLAVLAFVAADLRQHNGPNESTALPPAHYAALDPATSDPTIGHLKALLARRSPDSPRRDRVELLGVGFHWPNMGMIHGFDHAFGYNPLHMADFTEATGARDHMGEAAERRFTPLFPSFRSAFADMLGLRYVVSPQPIEMIDPKLRPGDLKLVAGTAQTWIYENERALPRAMFVGSWRLADFEALKENGLPAGFDPRGTVLLEQAPDDLAWREADSQKPGFLVLNDIWHAWWAATVNGEEADILRANAIFRAVTIPAGRSTVRFNFRPIDGLVAELSERFGGGDAADPFPPQVP